MLILPPLFGRRRATSRCNRRSLRLESLENREMLHGEEVFPTLVIETNVGNIPMEIGNLSKLQWFNLGNNQLNGSIPTEDVIETIWTQFSFDVAQLWMKEFYVEIDMSEVENLDDEDDIEEVFVTVRSRKNTKTIKNRTI